MQNISYQTEQLINSNGINISFDSFGDKSNPAILLIMGLATQMIFWDERFCRLLAAEGFWVVRFDNRDVGKSTQLDTFQVPSAFKLASNVLFKRSIGAQYLLDDMAKDTIGLLDALNISKVHLVGASMGAMIAQIIAITARERVLSLTSIMSTTGNRKLPNASLGFVLKILSRPPKNQKRFIPHALKLWESLHGKHFSFDKEELSALIASAIKRGISLAGGTRQLAAILDSPDRTSDLNKLDLPTLVIHGNSDPLIPVKCGYATAEAIPNSQLKIYDGMGHTIPSELYEDFCRDIVGVMLSSYSTPHYVVN